VALSEPAREIKFVVQVLLSIGITVKLPVVVRVDNVKAIFLAEKVSTSQKTKHINFSYHFVSEFVEEGFIKFIFVRTAENMVNIYTKNVSGDFNDKYTEGLHGRKEKRMEFK